ncbi:MAG TPA: hypothetical protein VLT88_01260 [Desulfosarcina sp.]|nr:hypothetical protein [Desulfosarcina sp.]
MSNSAGQAAAAINIVNTKAADGIHLGIVYSFFRRTGGSRSGCFPMASSGKQRTAVGAAAVNSAGSCLPRFIAQWNRIFTGLYRLAVDIQPRNEL